MAEEEELRRRKEEMVSVFLKMKLSREEQKSGLNSSKLIDHWRGTRREIKTKELQSEMSVQKDAFERALLKKNRHIELLLQVWYQPELSKHWKICLQYVWIINIGGLWFPNNGILSSIKAKVG